MSCASGVPTFRLLDAFVGWDPAGSVSDLAGFDDPAGLTLALETPDAVDPNDVLNYIPPPRIASGCGPCEWYLITPAPPSARLLRRTDCPGQWLPVWSKGCDPRHLVRPTAIAARGRRIAVSDPGSGKVWIWTDEGERLASELKIAEPGPVAIAPWGELFVVSKRDRILRYGASGESHGIFATSPEQIERIAISNDCRIWIVTRGLGEQQKLWSAHREDSKFTPATIDDLSKAFPPTGLVRASEAGFCVRERGSDGVPVTRCFSWYGRPIGSDEIKQSSPPLRKQKGTLLTTAIDSGIPRCRWHRVRVDADVPPGTTLRVRVATNESANKTPHALDWWPRDDGVAISSPLDFLIQQPRGRYLFLSLEMTGDGTGTPVVRRIRLDFPRSTSLEFLPPVYRERPDAEDFTERFLSLFDASMASLDRAIERFPALLDAKGVPDEILPWLGSFLDVTLERSWTPERMRNILGSVPELYRRRGTIAGLTQAIRLVFDVEPTIQEMAGDRAWAGLGKKSQLGTVRLFGKSRARIRLGSSALSSAPLRSFGDPDADPLIAHANRFRVLVPPSRQLAPHEEQRLQRLVETQKPAHTVASVRLGGNGFLLGSWSVVGVDTVFGTLERPMLGKNIRLRRASLLWHGPGGRRSGVVPGKTGVVGLTTIME